MDYAQKREEKTDQIGRQEDYASQTRRRLNPEDIELARKRVELGLYLEKAASLEKEFAALRRSLVEFRDRFTRLLGPKGDCLASHAPASDGVHSAGPPTLTNMIPFPVPTSPTKAEAGTVKVRKDRAPTSAYMSIIASVRDELRSEVLTAILDEDVLGGRKIPQAAFKLITGTAPAHCTEKPVGDNGNGAGTALITVIRDIYAARERVIFLYRGTMKLQFSMLHRLMTEVQKAGEANIDLLGRIAGSV
jgi:hypothetical protein